MLGCTQAYAPALPCCTKSAGVELKYRFKRMVVLNTNAVKFWLYWNISFTWKICTIEAVLYEKPSWTLLYCILHWTHRLKLMHHCMYMRLYCTDQTFNKIGSGRFLFIQFIQISYQIYSKVMILSKSLSSSVGTFLVFLMLTLVIFPSCNNPFTSSSLRLFALLT